MTAATQNGHTPTNAASPGFGATLRTLRESRGVSMVRLSTLAGIDHSTVSRLEAGTREPSRPMVLSLVAALYLDACDAARLMCEAGYLPDMVSVADVVSLVEWRAVMGR